MIILKAFNRRAKPLECWPLLGIIFPTVGHNGIPKIKSPALNFPVLTFTVIFKENIGEMK